MMKSLSSGGRPQAHTVAAGPVQFSFTVSQPNRRLVRSRLRFWLMQGLRFLRWLMQGLKLAGLIERATDFFLAERRGET